MTQVAKPVSPSINKPQSGGAAETVGSQLKSSPVLLAAVDAIVSELKSKSAQITDVRPPSAGLKQTYDALMARAAETRGRALLYPYIGSGIGNGALVELADGSVKWT